MSKSVLVMNTPEKGCISCLIGRYRSNHLETCIFCPIAKKIALDEDAETIPDWCPLKPLPEKFKRQKEMSYWSGVRDGWNACIDEITGGRDGKSL